MSDTKRTVLDVLVEYGGAYQKDKASAGLFFDSAPVETPDIKVLGLSFCSFCPKCKRDMVMSSVEHGGGAWSGTVKIKCFCPLGCIRRETVYVPVTDERLAFYDIGSNQNYVPMGVFLCNGASKEELALFKKKWCSIFTRQKDERSAQLRPHAP